MPDIWGFSNRFWQYVLHSLAHIHKLLLYMYIMHVGMETDGMEQGSLLIAEIKRGKQPELLSPALPWLNMLFLMAIGYLSCRSNEWYNTPKIPAGTAKNDHWSYT